MGRACEQPREMRIPNGRPMEGYACGCMQNVRRWQIALPLPADFCRLFANIKPVLPSFSVLCSSFRGSGGWLWPLPTNARRSQPPSIT